MASQFGGQIRYILGKIESQRSLTQQFNRHAQGPRKDERIRREDTELRQLCHLRATGRVFTENEGWSICGRWSYGPFVDQIRKVWIWALHSFSTSNCNFLSRILIIQDRRVFNYKVWNQFKWWKLGTSLHSHPTNDHFNNFHNRRALYFLCDFPRLFDISSNQLVLLAQGPNIPIQTEVTGSFTWLFDRGSEVQRGARGVQLEDFNWFTFA